MSELRDVNSQLGEKRQNCERKFRNYLLKKNNYSVSKQASVKYPAKLNDVN